MGGEPPQERCPKAWNVNFVRIRTCYDRSAPSGEDNGKQVGVGQVIGNVWRWPV